MTTVKLTPTQLREMVKEVMENPMDNPEWNEAVDNWRKWFEAVGFGEYMIDFGDVDPRVIVELGKTCRRCANALAAEGKKKKQ